MLKSPMIIKNKQVDRLLDFQLFFRINKTKGMASGAR